MVIETWAKEGHIDAEVNIDGNIVHHHDRVSSRRKSKGDGMIINTKDKLIVEQIVSWKNPV